MTVEAEIGSLRKAVETLEKDVDRLEAEGKEVRALLNRGRGAIWIIGLFGAAATFLLTQWRHVVDLIR
tara:strand:- start:269 stop:472 length:204 start_codon:yes stop_codon:yes gene_type:complete